MGFFDASIKLGLTFERLENLKDGCAVGGGSINNNGQDDDFPSEEIFNGSTFVKLETYEQRRHVAEEPTFSKHNQNKIQIFRVRRLTGSSEHSFRIKRVSRI